MTAIFDLYCRILSCAVRSSSDYRIRSMCCLPHSEVPCRTICSNVCIVQWLLVEPSRIGYRNGTPDDLSVVQLRLFLLACGLADPLSQSNHKGFVLLLCCFVS